MGKTLSIILKAPALMILIFAFLTSLYAAYNNIEGIDYVVPLVLGLALLFYSIGERIKEPKGKSAQELIDEVEMEDRGL